MASAIEDQERRLIELLDRLDKQARSVDDRKWVAPFLVTAFAAFIGIGAAVMKETTRFTALEKSLGDYSVALAKSGNSAAAAEQATGLLRSAEQVVNMTILGCIVIAICSLALLVWVAFYRVRHLNDSRDNFAAVAGVFMSEYSKTIAAMGAQLSESLAIANSLRAKYEPLLISWQRSATMERDAREIRVLTPNLAWLAEPAHFLLIAEDVLKHSDNFYRYLIYFNSDADSCTELVGNIDRVQQLSSDQNLGTIFADQFGDLNVGEHVRERIQFKLLIDRKYAAKQTAMKGKMSEGSSPHVAIDISDTPKPISPGNWRQYAYTLPLPGDMVIYSGLNLSDLTGDARSDAETIVLSRQPVTRRTLSSGVNQPDKEFDLLLPEASQVKSFRTWFDMTWES
jgi:hypothetical protein